MYRYLTILVVSIYNMVSPDKAWAQMPAPQMFYALNKNNFLLDQVPNLTPSVAYSVRKLKKSYTGFSMRVRRSGSGSPEGDVAFDEDGVVSASSIITISKSGGGYSVGNKVTFSSFYASRDIFVTRWYDQSGNGNNAVQGTGANQPQLVNSGTLITENGIATVEFSGAHTDIRLTLASDINLANGTLFGVCKVINPSSTVGIAENGTYSYNVNTYNNTGMLGVTHYTVVDVPSTLSYTSGLDALSWSKSSVNTYVEVNSRTGSGSASVNIPIAISQIYGNALAASTIRISEVIVTSYAPLTTRATVFSNQNLLFKTP